MVLNCGCELWIIASHLVAVAGNRIEIENLRVNEILMFDDWLIVFDSKILIVFD